MGCAVRALGAATHPCLSFPCPISRAACGEGAVPSEEEEVGEQVKSEEGGRVMCRPQERLKDGEETWREGAPLNTCP